METIPREIADFAEARQRDIDAYLTEAIREDDTDLMQMRLWLAYVKGIIDTHVRAQRGEEPNLRTIPDGV